MMKTRKDRRMLNHNKVMWIWLNKSNLVKAMMIVGKEMRMKRKQKPNKKHQWLQNDFEVEISDL